MQDKYLRPLVLLLLLGILASVVFPTVTRREDGFANNFIQDDDDQASKASSSPKVVQSLIQPVIPYSSAPSVPSSAPVVTSEPSPPPSSEEEYYPEVDEVVLPEPPPEPPEVSEVSSEPPSSLPSSEPVSSNVSSAPPPLPPKPDFDKFERDKAIKEIMDYAKANSLAVTISDTLPTYDMGVILYLLKQLAKFLPGDLLNDFGITILLTDSASPVMIGSTLKIARDVSSNALIEAAMRYMAQEVEQCGIVVDFAPLNPPNFDTIGISEVYLFHPETPQLSYFPTMRAQLGGAIEVSELFLEMINRQFRFVRITPDYPIYHKFMLVCPLLCERYPSLKQTKMGQVYS